MIQLNAFLGNITYTVEGYTVEQAIELLKERLGLELGSIEGVPGFIRCQEREHPSPMREHWNKGWNGVAVFENFPINPNESIGKTIRVESNFCGEVFFTRIYSCEQFTICEFRGNKAPEKIN